VFLPHALLRMAAQAERFVILYQQVVMGGLMRFMTGGALPLGIRSVGISEFFGQLGMAGKAIIGRPFAEKPCLLRGMRIMTGQAFPPAHRLVGLSLAMFCRGRGMAGVAEALHLLLEQSLVPGHMGVMAGGALLPGRRLMFDSLLKGGTVMAGETVLGGRARQGHTLGYQEQKASRYQCQRQPGESG
jgi:hypothetical protein